MKKPWTTKNKWGLALVAFTILSLSGYLLAVPPFNFGASAFEFDPFNTKLVSARWDNGAGCPTGATTNTGTGPVVYSDTACNTANGGGDPQDNTNKGLVLFKTGPTPNFAASGAFLTNVAGITLTELGYDLRKGSHCGAGAPRFNVVTTGGVLHFLGCSSPAPTSTIVGQGWTRMTWNSTGLAAAFPAISGTDVVESIAIVFDEGQDAFGGPDQSGTAVLDNINVNGVRVGK